MLPRPLPRERPRSPSTWPSELTTTGANLRAEVNPNGFATTYRFEYLTESAYEANPRPPTASPEP